MEKVKYIILAACLALPFGSCASQRYVPNKTITVNAYSDDISYNLDLQAVAAAFGEARDLEEFELILNDYDNRISNLDLNQDGYVDYLRVVEATDNSAHVVLIQAVLDRDIYQDVASIIVERRGSQDIRIQIVGDTYIYGPDYYFTPVFATRPPIYSYFWTTGATLWKSPYYWGRYPSSYRAHAPIHRDTYYSHIDVYLERHSYYKKAKYNKSVSYSGYNNLRSSVSRNDYSAKHPEKSFDRRVNATARSSSASSSRSSSSSSIKNARQLPDTRSATASTRKKTSSNKSSSATSAQPARSDGNSTRTRSSSSSSTRSSSTSTRSSSTSTRSSSTRDNDNSKSTRSSSSSSSRSSSRTR